MLDNWDIEHALRDVIANALDEQLLSDTGDVQIKRVGEEQWRILDHGHGLRIKNIIQLDLSKSDSDLPNDISVLSWSAQFGIRT